MKTICLVRGNMSHRVYKSPPDLKYIGGVWGGTFRPNPRGSKANHQSTISSHPTISSTTSRMVVQVNHVLARMWTAMRVEEPCL